MATGKWQIKNITVLPLKAFRTTITNPIQAFLTRYKTSCRAECFIPAAAHLLIKRKPKLAKIQTFELFE